MKVLFVSRDDGHLYERVDEDSRIAGFWELEVPAQIVLTPAQLCGGPNDLADLLVRTGQGKVVRS